MQHVAFIINPHSAKKNYQPFLNELQEKIDHPIYYISESIEGTDRFIKEHFNSIEIFVAVGGDGTISSVAQHLIHTDKKLAIYPAGSGNGFANETNFGKNLDQLLEKIKKNKFQKIDTVTVNGRLSINVSGVGFDSKVVKEFEKTTRGFLNYIKVSLAVFFRYQPVHLSFHEEQFKKYNGHYLMLNVANTRQFGNHAYIAPNADKTDGLAEAVLVKKFPFTYGLLFAYRMFTKRLKEDRYVSFVSTSEMCVNADTEDWHLDGEYHAIPSPVNIKIMPASLKVII